MMEGRLPPDDDEPFEWTDAPARPHRRREPEPYVPSRRERDPFESGTEERDPSEPGERTSERERHETGEGTAERELPRPGDPYEPGQEAYERAYDTGEDPYETGERLRPEEEELLDTAERRARERRERRGRRPPATGSLLQRHRDLPAKVRRRQAIGAIAIVVALLGGGYVLASGIGGGDDGEEPLPLKRLAGQTVVAPMDQGGPNKQLLKQARKGRIGGLIIVTDEGKGINPARLTTDVGRVQKAARSGGNPPLLVMLDQEGGFVKTLPGPPDISPNDLGNTGDPNVAKVEGQKTGQFLGPLGVNVNLAPLMDVTIPQTADTIRTRTFGEDPALVSEIGVAFIQGMQEAGVSATAKHFPGLGLSTVNTDFRRVDIAATPEDQDAALTPFQAAVDAGVDLVMMSSAIYPDLGSQEPAALSPSIVQGMLRDQFGFEGLVITDDLEARAILDVTSTEEAGVAALKAGCDLLLFGRQRRTATQGLEGILRAEKKGGIDRAAIEAAYERVTAFKASLGG